MGHDVEVTEQDELLVASAAIILVWRFPDWYYVNLHTVALVSGSFNEHSQFGLPDSGIQGMLCKKHPEVYEALKSFYKQDVAAITK